LLSKFFFDLVIVISPPTDFCHPTVKLVYLSSKFFFDLIIVALPSTDFCHQTDCFCPVVPEICRRHVHVAKKERRRIIIIRNRAKTISLQTMFGSFN
jgi:hypothetical protein